jgi:hypothetical protein
MSHGAVFEGCSGVLPAAGWLPRVMRRGYKMREVPDGVGLVLPLVTPIGMAVGHPGTACAEFILGPGSRMSTMNGNSVATIFEGHSA